MKLTWGEEQRSVRSEAESAKERLHAVIVKHPVTSCLWHKVQTVFQIFPFTIKAYQFLDIFLYVLPLITDIIMKLKDIRNQIIMQACKSNHS